MYDVGTGVVGSRVVGMYDVGRRVGEGVGPGDDGVSVGSTVGYFVTWIPQRFSISDDTPTKTNVRQGQTLLRLSDETHPSGPSTV